MTIDGVRFVCDSGRAKEMVFDVASGAGSLQGARGGRALGAWLEVPTVQYEVRGRILPHVAWKAPLQSWAANSYKLSCCLCLFGCR